SAARECGYSSHAIQTDEDQIYTDVLETDFLHLNDITTNPDWIRQVWEVPPVGTAGWGRNISLENVIPNPLAGDTGTEGVNGGDPGLRMRVKPGEPEGGYIGGAEIDTARRDMLYGSFRVGMKYTVESGTCGAFFFVSSPHPPLDKNS
ncbi:MAG: hypothetical protein Q9183_005894, partial [Haloplaca sp. 2 TL-2023]